MSPRTGRPTDNPRPNKMTIRVNDEDKKFVENYSIKHNVSTSEVFRRGIGKLKEEKK